MRRLDFNRDGDISIDELYNALRPYESGAPLPNYSRLASTDRRSPTISPDKVSFRQKELERITVDEIINKVKKGASKYQSFKHFVSAIMRRYDTDGDGYLNFKELSDGFKADGINLTHEEKLSLMKHLDTDCDGVVSRDEIFHALLLDSRHRRNHHHPKVNVDHLLRRIRQGAEKFKSLDAFVKYLFDKLDADGSGALSFNELSEGLTNMGIEISQKEKHALMKKLDDDADGEIGYDEFYKGLAEAGKFK
jgi:Ca2+-binding EF-hand superfamily protein